MSSSYERLENSRIKLSLEIPAEDFNSACLEAYKKMRGRFNIPGFRKGKAPKKIIENMYGEGVFYEDAIDIVFPDVYDAACDEHDLFPVSRPSITLDDISEDKAVKLTVEFDNKPEVTLGEYFGVEIEERSAEVSAEQADAEISAAREKVARFVDVERPVQNGDIIILDYSGSVDGVKFEGGTAAGQKLEIGSGHFIPGFEEQVVGYEKGASGSITVTFPEDYHSEDLQGKQAVFEITVHEIKQKELPELDDEFAQDVSEFDTLEEYKADILAKLQKDARERADMEMQNMAVEKAMENAQVDIPDSMVETQVENEVQQLAYQMSYQGIALQQYLEYVGMSMEELRDQQRPQAYNKVKARLVIEAILKAEGIECSDEDLDAHLTELAAKAEKSLEEYKKLLRDEDIEYTRQDLAWQKTLNLLQEKAKKIKVK